MKEIVEEIIRTEEEAKRMMEEARHSAAEIISDAEQQAKQLIEEAKKQAISERVELIKRAEESAKVEKEKGLKNALAEAQKVKKGLSSTGTGTVPIIEQIATKVFKRIIGKEVKR